MIYNISFNIATLILLLIVIFLYTYNRKFTGPIEKAFCTFCYTTLFTTMIDIGSAVTSSFPDRFSPVTQWTINLLYYVFVCAMPVIYNTYVLAITGHYDLLGTKKWKFLVYGPYLLDFALVASSPFCNTVFTINEANQYQRSPGVLILYFFLAYHIVLSSVILYQNRKKIGRTKHFVSQSFIIYFIAGVIIQFVFPSLLLQNFCSSVSILLVFFTLYSPGSKIDPSSDLYNQHALNLYTWQRFEKKEDFSIVTIIIDEMPFYISTFSIQSCNMLSMTIGTYLKITAKTEYVFNVKPGVFAIAFPAKDSSKAENFASTIKKRFEEQWKIGNIDINIGIRQCIIKCPDDAKSAENVMTIINTASDKTMYKAEKLLLASAVDIKSEMFLSHVNQLIRNAIKTKSIDIYFQPIWSVKKQRIVGAEALFRLKDDTGSFIDAEIVAKVAERNGDIVKLGRCVFEEVCMLLMKCRKEKLRIDMMNVNLSVIQCMNMSIVSEFKEITDKYGVSPSFINLEIAENAVASRPEMLSINMNKFIEAGFDFFLDDYGSGLANIDYLLHFPFSTVKLDKKLLRNALKENKAHIFLTSTISMLKNLDLKIVVEGVENEETADMLIELDCDFLQGYHFSEPLPENDFYELIRKECSF